MVFVSKTALFGLQAFFEWQTRGGWALMAQDAHVQKLVKWFHFATDTFLAAIGQPQVEKRRAMLSSRCLCLAVFPYVSRCVSLCLSESNLVC